MSKQKKITSITKVTETKFNDGTVVVENKVLNGENAVVSGYKEITTDKSNKMKSDERTAVEQSKSVCYEYDDGTKLSNLKVYAFKDGQKSQVSEIVKTFKTTV